MFSFPSVSINVFFILDGSKYEVEKFKLGFDQEIDFKGQPQHEVSGGQILITLNQMPDNNLYLWAKKSTLLKNGQIIFQTDLGMSVLRINFENAYCINLTKEIDAMKGTISTLIISPEKIFINEIEHDNFWKNNRS